MHCDKSPVPGMKSSKSGGLAYTSQPPNYSSYLHQVAEYPGEQGPDGPMILRHSFHAANTFRDGCGGGGGGGGAGPAQQTFLRADHGRSTATLPRNMGVLGKAQECMGAMAPNGCAQPLPLPLPLHHTLPRPPPPPRVNSRASEPGALGGDPQPQRDLRLPQAALSEMRV